MKHKTKPNELLGDLIDGSVPEEFRTDTLNQMLDCARRKRRHRRQLRFLAGAVVPLVVVVAIFSLMKPRKETVSEHSVPSSRSSEKTKTIEGTNIRILTDDELFAMFPGRPLAVIGRDRDSRLVFLDELK